MGTRSITCVAVLTLAVGLAAGAKSSVAAELPAIATITHYQSNVTGVWPGAVALAGDRVVWVDQYWTGRSESDDVGYWGWSAQIGGSGLAQRLFTEAPVGVWGDDIWNFVPSVSGSAERVVVTTGVDGSDVTGNVYRERRDVRSGHPAGPLTVLVPDSAFGALPFSGFTQPPDVSGHDVVAVERVTNEGPYRVVIRDARTGALLMQAGASVAKPDEYLAGRVAGNWVAVDDGGLITVFDRVTGQGAYSVATHAKDESSVAWDLQDDGTLVARVPRSGAVAPATVQRYDLTTASPASPQLHVIAEDVGLGSAVRVAQGRVAFVREHSRDRVGPLMLMAVDGGAEQRVTDTDIGAFDFDGSRVAYITAVDACVFVADAPPPGSTTPFARGSCPEMTLRARLPARWRRSQRTLTVQPFCQAGPATGCHGAVTVRGRTRGGSTIQLAAKSFEAPVGIPAQVPMAFSRKQLARLRYSTKGRANLQIQALTTGWLGTASTTGRHVSTARTRVTIPEP